MSSSPETRSAKECRRHDAPVIAGAALAVFLVWMGVGIGGADVTTIADDVMTVAAAAVATIACARAGTNAARETARFWRLLGAACGAWAFGEAAWAVYDVTGSVPVPSYADIGYLAAIPLAVAALVQAPGTSGDVSRRMRAVVDAGLLATSLLFISWTFLLATLWHHHGVATAAGVVTIAYPFGDVVMTFFVVRALGSLDGLHRAPLAWVLVGLTAMTVSDSGYTYLTAVHDYATGNLIDGGWVAAYLAIAVGACRARATATPVTARRVIPPAWSMLLPYLPPLLAVSIVASRVQSRAAIDPATLVLAFAVTVLVLLRQTAVPLIERARRQP